MTREDFETLSTQEQLSFYRCPACGEMVDNRQLDEITLHHSHVLNPERFHFLPALFEESASSKST